MNRVSQKKLTRKAKETLQGTLATSGAGFVIGAPCNKTARRRSPPCHQMRRSTRLDRFCHFGFQNPTNIDQGGSLWWCGWFWCVFFGGACVRLTNPLPAIKPPADVRRPVTKWVDQPIKIDFATVDFKIQQILTKWEAYDDVADFDKPPPCNKTLSPNELNYLFRSNLPLRISKSDKYWPRGKRLMMWLILGWIFWVRACVW